jgi:hypothetical protein
LKKGAIAEAEIHARNAVPVAPENPQSHNLMGMVMTEANRPQIGEYHYRKVLALTQQRDPILLANLAWNLKNQGRMAESRDLYEEATAAGPEVLQTLLGWARWRKPSQSDRFLPEPDRPTMRDTTDRVQLEAGPRISLSISILVPKNVLVRIDSPNGISKDGNLGQLAWDRNEARSIEL